MHVPTAAQLRAIADDLRLGLTDDELAALAPLLEAGLAPFEHVRSAAASPPAVERPPVSGRAPAPEENPFGGWRWRAEIAVRDSGPLAGHTLAVKDNISVAGLPLTAGSAMLEGLLAPRDATAVTRVLEAGATITGTAVCEAMCASGGSHTSDHGIVRNPYDPDRTPGGSSTGCAALVASGEVDIALGTDQAGSVRIPASWSGLVGLKPTFGLVPYTGGFPLSPTMDHIGPIARTVDDVALCLDVIAGPDGEDPRQWFEPDRAGYRAQCGRDVRGLRVGVLREGFALPGLSEPEVDAAVEAAAHALAALGAELREVSVPIHREAAQTWTAIALGEDRDLFAADAAERWGTHYPAALLDAYAGARNTGAHLLPPSVKLLLLTGEHAWRTDGAAAYLLADRQRQRTKLAYDRALADVDVLLLPTTPQRATPIPGTDAPLWEVLMRAFEMTANTCPFNLSGHPALNVPCALVDGLPVGLMLVGRRGHDGTVLRAGAAFQREVFGPPSPPAR
jgi:amidase